MRPRFVFLLIATTLVLSACNKAGATTVPTMAAIPTATSTALPELTATPATPLVILIVAADMDTDTSNLYQKTVYDLAQASGMRYQVRNVLMPAELEPGLKVVIALPPDPGIAALAASAPGVQFLAINIPGVAPGGNISVLGDNSRSDISAFLAGYTAALITDDYRIGMMIPKGNPEAQNAFAAFRDGMLFSCGLCRPVFYPAFCLAENLQQCYPQVVEIPSEEDKSKYGPYADYLIVQRKVNTIYIHPDVYTPDLVDYIGTTGTVMLSTVSPAQIPGGWVMTIQPDTIKAIQSAWPQLVAGQGGLTIQSPLGLSNIDPGILSPGKQLKVQKTLDDLQAGFIVP